MNLEPHQLEAKGYVLQDKLEHEELLSFIKTYIKKRTVYGLGFYIITFLILVGLMFYYNYLHHQNLLTLKFAVSNFMMSMGLAFLLVPLHEYLHVLAYRWQGAKKTSYDVQWRKLLFMALADGFVANKKEFKVIALTPVVIISTLLFVVALFTPPSISFICISILFWHFSFCAGDFGLLSYFEFYKSKEVVTYDDVQTKTTYFYSK